MGSKKTRRFTLDSAAMRKKTYKDIFHKVGREKSKKTKAKKFKATTPETTCQATEDAAIPAPLTLRLGPRAELVYLEDVSKWIAPQGKRDQMRPGPSTSSCMQTSIPETLKSGEVEALQRLCQTIRKGYYASGVYKVKNPALRRAYKAEKRRLLGGSMVEVYQYHGAAFPVLANIVEEGFDLSASRWGEVFVSNRSDYSLGFSVDTFRQSRPGQPAEVMQRVHVRQKQLEKEHKSAKKGNAPAVPLLSNPPDRTHAMLVCKALVPVGHTTDTFRDDYRSSWLGQEGPAFREYSTGVTEQLCPHFLVQIAPF